MLKELRQLNPCKSTSLDEIPARFLKEGADFLKIPITFLVNMSISENCVPDAVKNCKSQTIKPLYKKNSNLDVGNYKPVSILSVVSKIFEKAVYVSLKLIWLKTILSMIISMGSEAHSLQILALFIF